MLSSQLREAACWRTVAEVTRRCPGRIRVYETHGEAFVQMSWQGSELTDGGVRLRRDTGDASFVPFHVGYQPESTWAGYLDAVAGADDPAVPISQLCSHAGLSVGKPLPSSTPDVVAYRVVAAFLTHACFGRAQWACHNGRWDTSDGGFDRDDYFGALPVGVREALTERRPDDLFGQPA